MTILTGIFIGIVSILTILPIIIIGLIAFAMFGIFIMPIWLANKRHSDNKKDKP